MNSTEDILRYNDNSSHYCSPVLARRNVNSYNLPEKSPKKDKKWSFGSLFRRKKKESDSSSEEENQCKNFLQKKKKKSDKRKRQNIPVGFDHVVVPSNQRQTNGHKEDDRVLSEPLVPINNFITASDLTNRFIPSKDFKENFNCNELDKSSNSLGSPSVCSLGRRKKGNIKGRSRRNTSKGEESSDDDSQVSIYRSDESLSKQRDGSLSRRSRAARTQRYLRRRSKDEELRDSPKLPFDMKNLHFKEEKSEKHLLKSTIYTNTAPASRPNFSGLTTIPPSHNSYNKCRIVTASLESPNKHISYIESKPNAPGNRGNRSVSYDSNMNNTSSSEVNGTLPMNFPMHNSFNKYAAKKYPPPPPPRDLRRIIVAQNGDSRPMSYSFENAYKNKPVDYNLNKPDSNHNFRSTSDDHISCEPMQRVPLVPRPSSTTPEVNSLQKHKNVTECEEKPSTYRYLTDKSPRSRKPICIQNENEQVPWSQKTFKFWRQKEEEVLRNNNRKSASASPLIFTAQSHVTTNIFLPNNVKTGEHASTEGLNRPPSPFRLITTSKASSPEGEDAVKRKSTNLADALDELEAIYNSLHLGDEDLLDRAEKREADVVQKKKDIFSDARDSSFVFDPNFDSTRKKRTSKKSEPNIKTDDMAFRKLNRQRYNTISDPQSTVSSISYLLTSPVFNVASEELSSPKIKSDEPDVTFDDVVFRNVMHTNNMLKVADPQPPFGIPVGPISPAANSDYLRIMPYSSEKDIVGSKNVPDVIKDDLAYRNLRKDTNKGISFPQIHDNDVPLNYDKSDGMRRKRAVRSLSANISNLMHNNDIKTNDYYPPQNLTDVADALEIARQILKDKEDRINATRQAFMSDGEMKYRWFESKSPIDQRSRLQNENKLFDRSNDENTSNNYLSVAVTNGERVESKPPTPDRRASRLSKESTPIPSSPSDDIDLKKQLNQSTLDELLMSLAVETRETSDQIIEELNQLDELQSKPESTKKIIDSFKTARTNINEDHVKLCENLLQCVVVNNELLAENTEELDVCEEVSKIKIDPIPEIVANVVILPSDKSKLELNPVSTEVYSESDHDYVNIQSNANSEKEEESEEMFSENKEKDDLLAAFEAVDETLRNMNNDGSSKDVSQNIEQVAKDRGEACVSIEYIALPTKGCAYVQKSQLDFNISNHGNKGNGQNFISELVCNNTNHVEGAQVKCDFRIGGEVNSWDSEFRLKSEENLESLKSPKLVQHLDRNYKHNEGEDLHKAEGHSLEHTRDYRHTSFDETQPSCTWYENPNIIAVACSFGIACTTQLPSFDIIAVLGLLLAIISLLLALLARV